MLTRPELESKQLLVVSVEPGKKSRLKVKNQNLVYEKDGKIVNQCSLSRLLHLMVIGDISITTNLIRDLNKHGISVCLMSSNLKPFASFGFENEANFMLRRQQYLLTDRQNLEIAKTIISDKIHNQSILLNRINLTSEMIYEYFKASRSATSAKELLGIEGNASKIFFHNYFEAHNWTRRAPRLKTDPVNFLLDIGYTILFNFTDSVCRHFGLDTYKGVYHTQFFARKSLICDLMEPFRCLIDSRTRTALSLGILKPEMFKTNKYGVYADWKDTSRIVQLYSEEVLKNRQQIFFYIQGFYKFVMDPENNQLTRFRLKR